ncbi:MAG: cysteine-S-conjugate beta-lyase [Sphingomonadales bacterium]|nr:cysteine-S-conjugate beta-lyase [Sphingomonadales bacterium]
MTDRKKGKATTLVHGGRRKEWRGRLVNVPVERASTILFDNVADLQKARPGLGQWNYGLQGTATHWALSEALTEIEPGAAGTALYSTGLAAVSGALLAVLSAGDELLVVDSVYGPTRKFCDTILKRLGIAVVYYDPLAGNGIAELFTERTRAILLESPGSLTMEVQDVPGICAIARERGIVTLLDNTWASPLLFPALAAGVDISILALSKYVGGHSDVMIGAATANAQHFPRLQKTCWDLGHAVSPDDAWLASRGLRTLGVRLKQHEENALAVVHWVKARPEVGLVLHPALPECPGHEIWKRDFSGSSGLFSFELKDADAKSRAAFVDSLKLFGIGFSWGGYESLVLPIDPVRTASTAPAPNLVRLHVGLEDPEDLIADLEAAFAQAGR